MIHVILLPCYRHRMFFSLILRYSFASLMLGFILASTKHSDIPHILFDYHAEGGSKKLEKLDSKMAKYVEKLDCFYGTGSTVHKLQSGVIRTNCADCLDRTNAVQLFIGELHRYLGIRTSFTWPVWLTD